MCYSHWSDYPLYNWDYEQDARDIRNARRRELYAMKKAQKQKDLALFTPSLESVIEESVHESRSTKPASIDRLTLKEDA